MGAHKRGMTSIENTMLHTLNWLENSFEGHCGVLDIEWETGALILYGNDCTEYRNKFNEIMEGVM